MKTWVVRMLSLPALVIAALFVDAASLTKRQFSESFETPTAPASLVLALEYENSEPQSGPEPASLQLPAANEENRNDRRCMTVCSRWGEDCVMLSPAADVLAKKCVRTCKTFAEECL